MSRPVRVSSLWVRLVVCSLPSYHGSPFHLKDSEIASFFTTTMIMMHSYLASTNPPIPHLPLTNVFINTQETQLLPTDCRQPTTALCTSLTHGANRFSINYNTWKLRKKKQKLAHDSSVAKPLRHFNATLPSTYFMFTLRAGNHGTVSFQCRTFRSFHSARTSCLQ